MRDDQNWISFNQRVGWKVWIQHLYFNTLGLVSSRKRKKKEKLTCGHPKSWRLFQATANFFESALYFVLILYILHFFWWIFSSCCILMNGINFDEIWPQKKKNSVSHFRTWYDHFCTKWWQSFTCLPACLNDTDASLASGWVTRY